MWGHPYLQNSKEQLPIETIDYNDAIGNNVEEIKLSTITMITKVITGIEINQVSAGYFLSGHIEIEKNCLQFSIQLLCILQTRT